MKLAIILGTRPEIIKMAPLIRACIHQKVDFFILHTGQHYSYEMDKKFFEDLELPHPKYNLSVGSQPYRKQVGLMVRSIQETLQKEKPRAVIVQGDTVSVLAGALAASKLKIPVVHHEAGLRSHDLTMLEETNRIITDHISEYLFAPTEAAVKNLTEEGLPKEKIRLVGNSIVDAVYQNKELAQKKVDVLSAFKLEARGYLLVTAHRAENVDVKERLTGILEGLRQVADHFKLPVVFPIHPRTKKRVDEFGLTFPQNITFIEPVGFLEFLQLEEHAKLILTDSGGVQEEACILHVPCVTLRDNTERPETIAGGMNVLAGTTAETILKCAQDMAQKDITWKNPFGDGKTGERIIRKLVEDFA